MARRANRTPVDNGVDAGQSEAFELEQQNDRHLESLAAKVTALHSVSININDDVNSQNRLLERTNDTFNRFGNMFGRTRRQLKHTLATANSRFLFYMVCILVFGVIGLYYIAKHVLAGIRDPYELP
ncbi:protein transport protein bet1 [Coemansia sp. RSA 1813]|nr:protein transport protein bet1 [Coemansia sp. RSA 1646]KAJ1768373.1 protein transport protein bet1 [Coemansia sp. RSA 1843]KAJ2087909.1 protein transport protein bet1 [Coemansia sp. RSA 986]KAJ2212895.1 protein transport protein bet1 [Coemansia sp. RSA 487]KAJ2567666.1 protein transport protein bet1 [Coemansia sp. RSA 1813]